jgi:hypothetical protein
LSTIPALSGSESVEVTGPAGGPFLIRFGGVLSGTNQSSLTATATGGTTADVSPVTEGSPVTAASVSSSLQTIPALAGHVNVSGANNGPFTITFNPSSLAKPLTVTSETGGVMAFVNPIIGATGFRVFSVSGTTKKLVATLAGTATSATISGLKPSSKVTLVVEAYSGSTKADSSPVTVQLDAASFTVTRKLTPPGTTTVELDWTTYPGATSYRIYRVTSTGSRVLVATRTSSATSVQLSGFPASTKFVVQAVSGSTVLKASSPV